jgi:hypothetical protein
MVLLKYERGNSVPPNELRLRQSVHAIVSATVQGIVIFDLQMFRLRSILSDSNQTKTNIDATAKLHYFSKE